jgi:hypothetical protein
LDGEVLVPTFWQQVIGGVWQLMFLKRKSSQNLHVKARDVQIPCDCGARPHQPLGSGDAKAKCIHNAVNAARTKRR